jgi:hypothetical protein
MPKLVTASSQKMLLTSLFTSCFFLVNCGKEDEGGYYDTSWDVPRNSNIIWDKTYGGTRHEEIINDLKTARDGGTLMLVDVSTANKLTLVKLDARGSVVWEKVIDGEKDDSFGTLLEAASGEILVACASNSGIGRDKSDPLIGSTDIWLVKLDANGNKIWDKTYGGIGTEYVTRILENADGYLLTGTSNSPISGTKTSENKGKSDLWIIQLDTDGNVLWDKTIGGDYYDTLNDVLATPDGGYLLSSSSLSGATGDKSDPTFGLYDYWIVKLSATGEPEWDISYGTNQDDNAGQLLAWPDGSYSMIGITNAFTVVGTKESAPIGRLDAWLVNFNEGGALNWERTLGTPGKDLLSRMVKTTDNRIFVGLSTNGVLDFDPNYPEALYYNGLFMEINTSGEVLQETIIAGNNTDYLTDFILTQDGNLNAGFISNSEAYGDKSEDTWPKDRDAWLVKMDLDW